MKLFERQRPVDAFVQRDEGFGALDAAHFLDLIVQHFAQVLRVAADDLGKDAVVAGGVMNVYNFGILRNSSATWL
jgi:hypothetical protein